MKLRWMPSKTPKPGKACSKDQSRPVLTMPWLRLNERKKDEPLTGFIEATDSFKMVSLPVEFDEAEAKVVKEGFLPAKALEARKAPPWFTEEGVVADGVTHPYPPLDAQWPKFDQLLPGEQTISDFRVGINAKILAELAESMGTETVVLEFSTQPGDERLTVQLEGKPWLVPTNLRAIRVRPLGGKASFANVVDGPLGIVMPIRIAS